jgi:hypothetical protein
MKFKRIHVIVNLASGRDQPILMNQERSML